MDTVYIMRRTYLTVILSVVFCACAFCREAPGKNRIRMAFYNTENMFDTLASKTYDDAEFTPSGKNAWDGRKYRTKIKNTARVLADMNADIIGLAEIENDGVLADLVGSLPAGYWYVHMETADNRGIDPALLYKKRSFQPCVVDAGGESYERTGYPACKRRAENHRRYAARDGKSLDFALYGTESDGSLTGGYGTAFG